MFEIKWEKLSCERFWKKVNTVNVFPFFQINLFTYVQVNHYLSNWFGDCTTGQRPTPCNWPNYLIDSAWGIRWRNCAIYWIGVMIKTGWTEANFKGSTMDIIIIKEALCWTKERTTRGAPPFGSRLLIMYQVLTDYFFVFYVDMKWAN